METSNSRRCFQRRQPASRASTPAPRPPPWRRREEVEPDTVLVLLLLHLSSAHSLWRPQKGTKAGGLIAIAVEVEERRIRRRRRQCPLRWASLRGPIASPSRLSRTDRRLEALDGDAEGQAQGRKVGCLLFSMASFLLQSPLFPLESERGGTKDADAGKKAEAEASAAEAEEDEGGSGVGAESLTEEEGG